MKERIARWAADKEWIEYRPVFGLEAFLHLGNFMAGDDLGALILRLDPEAQQEALKLDGARMWRAGGPGTASYVRIPIDAVGGEEELRGWLDKALAFTATLPPKDRLVTKETKVPDFITERESARRGGGA